MTDTTTAPPPTEEAFPDPDAADAPPEPTDDEVALADEVFVELENRGQLGDQQAIDLCISIVDVHRHLRTPDDLFAASSDEDPKFSLAENVAQLVRFLTSHCPRLEIAASNVVVYWKDHEKWTSAGQTVYGKAKALDGLMQHHLDGMRAVLVVNYHAYKHLNPRQKVFWIYHLLRGLDAEAKTRAADWSGYFEEPGLFGAGVMSEMVTMARGFVKEAPAHVGDPHQLSVLDEVYDGRG